MAAALAWFQLDLRRRWRSLLVLTLLIALASGTVLTALAGALRGASAVDRLLARTLPATVEVVPNDPEFDWDVVRDLPDVAAVGLTVWTAYQVDGIPVELPIPADDGVLRTVERPVVLDGRLADPDRADEAVVTSSFVDTYGKGVGDTVTVGLFAPETIDRLWADPDAVPDGPRIRTEIVGVVRSFLLTEGPEDPWGTLIPSPGLFAEYAPNLLGVSGSGGMTSALVRLEGGEQDIRTFAAELSQVTGRSDIDVWSHADSANYARDVSGFESSALLVFAVAAGTAAVFLVGQAVVRFALSATTELRVLRSLGLPPLISGLAAALGPVLAAFVGVMLGIAGAVIASRWFPYGAAAWLEPSPGIDIDLRVLGTALLAVPLFVAVGAVTAALFADRTARGARPVRRSAVVSRAARASAPVPVVVGAGFALEPGGGARAVPVRPALIGAVIGVAGVMAALTFSSGIDDAASNPARFGQVHQLEVPLGVDGQDAVPAGDVLEILAADPDVAAVNDSRSAVAQYAGVPTTVYSLDGTLDAVVTNGRLPTRPDEISLAPYTARAAGADVGDTVEIAGTRVNREMAVTGFGLVPEGELNYYSTGSWVSGPAFDELFDTYLFRTAHVALRDGVDPTAVQARLAAAVSEHGAVVQPAFERSAAGELQQIRRLPVFLAGFLAVLAVAAVGHALATAVRRRRHDLAILRAHGMTSRQSRGVVLTQSSVLALVGVLVGTPLGVALGRTVWRYYADTTFVHYVPPVAVLALALGVPVALLAANVLAAWPGHRAASLRVADVLRAE